MSDYLIRPTISASAHPVESGDYLIGTPATYQMRETIKSWFDLRVPGGMVYGPPRFGKTRAIRYLSFQLNEFLGGQVPIVTFIAKDHSQIQEKTFYDELLAAVGYIFTKTGSASVRRQRLVELLCGLCTEDKTRRLIVFIDEAQKLEPVHYNWLVDLYNDMDSARIQPMFILVGQQELATRRNTMVATKRFQVVGRFMNNTHQFRGLTCAEDLRACLHCYDENSEFPLGSGWSFSRFFFPAAFACGWRLANSASDLWSAFMEIRRVAKLPGKREVPMSFFAMTVERTLRHCSSLEALEPMLTPAIWKESIEASGYHLVGDFISADGAADV